MLNLLPHDRSARRAADPAPPRRVDRASSSARPRTARDQLSLFSSAAEGVELSLLGHGVTTEVRVALTRSTVTAGTPTSPTSDPAPATATASTAIQSGRRSAVQPGEAAARPVRRGDRRRGRLGPGVLRLRLRPPDEPTTIDTGRTCRAPSSATRSSTGATTSRRHRHARHDHLRAHVKGLTATHPTSRRRCAAPIGARPPRRHRPPDLPRRHGVELMPVHAFVHDPHLVQRGLRNYWGYNSVAFLAPQTTTPSPATARPSAG